MRETVQGIEDSTEIKLELADCGKINTEELDHDSFEFVDCMETDGTVDIIREPLFDPLADCQVKVEDEEDFEDITQEQFMLVDPACMKHAPDRLDTPVALLPVTQSREPLRNLVNDMENENSKAYEVSWDQEEIENDALFSERLPLSGLENNYHQIANFKETSQSRIQTQTNENEKRYKCNQCIYKSSRKGNLKSHMVKHTDEKKYKCTMCNYRTPYNHLFKTHTAVHRGEKKYSCTECRFKTAYGNFLKVHLARHRGEKKFSCPECSYKTLYKQCLIKHIAIVHRNEKKFGCMKCNFRTGYHSSLKLHLLTHMPGRKCYTYYCANCSYATTFHQSFSAHLRQCLLNTK